MTASSNRPFRNIWVWTECTHARRYSLWFNFAVNSSTNINKTNNQLLSQTIQHAVILGTLCYINVERKLFLSRLRSLDHVWRHSQKLSTSRRNSLYTHFINTKLIHVFYYDDYTIIGFLSTDPNRIAIVSFRFLHVLVWFVLLILSNYKCPTRLPYQIMCVSFNSNMAGGAGPASQSGAPVLTPSF